MKIPKNVKIAGHNYKVKFDDKRLSEEGFVGEADHHLDIIYLCKDYRGHLRNKSEIEETLIHEILHCVDVNYNNHSLGEKVVDRLSCGLHQVLKDNFKL